MEQLNHYNTDFKNKQFPITVVCDEVYFQENIGSIFRVCEAFGVEKIIFTGKNFVFSERKINKISRSTHKIVPYQIIEGKNELIAELKMSDVQIIALEITSASQPIQSLEIDSSKPITLLIGSEVYGISNEILAISHQQTHITMFGKNSSMNVVQSLGICLYELTNKLF